MLTVAFVQLLSVICVQFDWTEASGTVLGKQKGLDLISDIDNDTRPGLYWLGRVEEDGVIESISARGEVMCEEQPNAKTRKGMLRFFLLRPQSTGGYANPIIETFKTRECKDNETSMIVLPGKPQRLDFKKGRIVKKDDLITMYILDGSLQASKARSNYWWYPLHVGLNSTREEVPYKFYTGSDNLGEKFLGDINKNIRDIVETGGDSSWEDADPNLEFNVQVKIQYTNNNNNKNRVVRYSVGAVIILLLVAVILLLAIVAYMCGRKRQSSRNRHEEIMLKKFKRTKDGHNIHDQSKFNSVDYELQQDQETATGKTVINIHIAKQMALSRTRQPYHEYALLTETKDESPVSTVPPHLEPFEDHDYDELYFEPACKEEELLSQLRKLGVPIIPREALKVLTGAVLGCGAFGTVFRGVWVRTEGKSGKTMVDEVAVKILDGKADDETRVKFLQEAAIVGQFDHPNIIRLLGVSVEGSCQVVTEIMINGDLRNHLQGIKPSVVDQDLAPTLLSYSRHIANGMVYLAVKSFIHRDLAARNILVAEDGACKIADFGFSRELQEDDFYKSSGGKIPVKWTAPEALNYRKYSTASDVWSYGCVLYEIWSLGEKPYNDLTNEQMIKKLPTGYRLPPPPGCPRDIYQLMIQCWNADPVKRPSFMDITSNLQKPDFQLLNWSEDELTSSEEEARTLGAPLEAGYQLYDDLQKIYV